MSLWPSMADHSNRTADEYIDDALITDSVKKLLSDNSDPNHFDLLTASSGHSSANCGPMGGHSGATVQEGMDLVDALDTLVQKLSRESNKALTNDLESSLTPREIVFFDHNYCKMDLIVDTHTDHSSTAAPKPVTNNLSPVQSSSFTPFNDNSYASSSTVSATSPAPQTPGSPPVPQTPPTKPSLSKTPPASRRSLRQIERIEKTVLEKIKAENQEMLKREKEEMESPNKLRKASESMDETKDIDDKDLVIDTDKGRESRSRSTNKKRTKRSRSQSSEPAKKSKIDSKTKSPIKADSLDKSETQPKTETSEMDDVIAALRSGASDTPDDDKTSTSGRTQRNRRKPKRWDDDEVEVDFSGQLGILAEQKQKQENDENRLQDINKLDDISDKSVKTDEIIETKPKANESQASDEEHVDDEEDSGSDFGSEDDPDKLWCICRQPHDDRFMIGCDSCEEWFHGKCVNVTKQQGRAMEKAGQEWLCPTCIKGIANEVPRAELKRQADEKRIKLEAEERLRAQTKRAAKEKFLKRERSRDSGTGGRHRERRDSDSKSQKQSPEQRLSALAKKVSHMPPKKRELHLRHETEEKEKLKKLIKSSKKEFNKKRELLGKKFSKHKDSSRGVKPGLEPISKVVPIVRKPEVKKKHKDAIDPSVQDLFKAEPIRKSSVPSTPTTPNTPGSAPFTRKPSLSDGRRISTSGPVERPCPSGCGKSVRSDSTIYCSNECIETHVNECLKLLRTIRREKIESGIKSKDIDKRVVVVEKSTGRLLSGKDSIPEHQVLEFIKTNQMFEILKPSNFRDKKREETNSKNLSTPHSPHKSPKKDDKNRSSSGRQHRISESDGCDKDKIRENVKTSLKETLLSRCKDANDVSISSDEMRKTANRIEEELFKFFNKDTSVKYKNKFRSLIFNLKDVKNQGLFRKVVTGKISPERLVQMSAEELASSELAKWREREKISMLEMIKRDAQEKANQVIVKKTHKGEEVIEAAKVDEIPLEPNKDEPKTSTPVPVSTSHVSTILDDLMGSSNVDTTSQHKTHLFSNNCRICMKTEDNKLEISKKSAIPSSTREESSSRPTPKRVRVDPDSANKILLEAAKLSSSSAVKRTTTIDDDDSGEMPTSTVSLSSPEVPTSSSASRPIWKGTVFMQDVAKFAANAVKVSGIVGDYLSQDIPSQMTVIGRIAPEQVLDYVKKLRYSARTEIGLVKLISPKEERIGYDAFFDYLDTRKRYGVVGNTGKALKDFYILPLPKNGDIPDVLLPLDGPGLDKKSNRPNLLLGILIRSKVHVKPQTSSAVQSQTKTKTTSDTIPHTRSYTPPPIGKTPSNDSKTSSEDSKDGPPDGDDMGSYTPPPLGGGTSVTPWKSKSLTAADDEPYDPEEADLSNSLPVIASTSSLGQSSQTSIEQLMDQIAKSTNPVEMTSSVLSAIAGSSNLELQRRLLDQLTQKVDEQKRQLEEQKAEAEANRHSGTLIPGLDGQFAAFRDITVPDNLSEILSTVEHKTREIEAQQERLRKVAEHEFRLTEDPIVEKFGSKEPIKSQSPEVQPMDLDEEVTGLKSTIIEINTPVNTKTAETTISAKPKQSITDPRLRSKKQTPLPSIAQESGTDSRVAAMTADELMQKAKEQMAALAQMEATSKGPTNTSNCNSINSNTNTNNNNNNVNKSQKIKIEWKKRK